MTPTLAWAALSRNALARAEAQLTADAQGVRDEVGVLALHKAYADRFFPGTSVQHTRLRYALFVPWTFGKLLKDKNIHRGQASQAMAGAELKLAQRLVRGGEEGVIGKQTVRMTPPRAPSIPPSTSYWSALATWGILQRHPTAPTPSRAEVYRLWERWAERHQRRHLPTDDENRLIYHPHALFHPDLPAPPADFHTKGALSFAMTEHERAFMRDRLSALRRSDQALSFLARLVRAGAPTDVLPWSDSLIAIADRADRAALERARDAAALSAVTRAFYLACVETMKDELDHNSQDTIHREALPEIVHIHRHNASRLNLKDLPKDGVILAQGLEDALKGLQQWLKSEMNPMDEDVRRLLSRWELARKGATRARLPRSGHARQARASWVHSGLAEPIGYRWGSVRQLLIDLRGD